MANLVDNAIRHNVDGGQVEISTAKPADCQPYRSATPEQ